MIKNEFSVYWWDRDGGQHEELRFVSPEKAMQAYHRLTTGPATLLGIVQRVIITDGGDRINMEWKDGNQVFPQKESK